MTTPASGWSPPSGTRACQHCEARIWKVPHLAFSGPGGPESWADTDGGWYCMDGTLRHAPMPEIPPLEET